MHSDEPISHQTETTELSERAAQLRELEESWILKKVSGQFCRSCRLYYRGSQDELCWKCGRTMSGRMWYERTQIETITAILIWGVLTAGIAWAIMLAGKIFFGVKYFPPLIYDPASVDPVLNNPNDPLRTSNAFSFKEARGMVFLVPLVIIVVLIAVAVVFFFGALISGVLKKAF